MNTQRRLAKTVSSGGCVVVEESMASIRSFVTAVVDLASRVDQAREGISILALNEPEIGSERLVAELDRLLRLFRPDLAKRIMIAQIRNGVISGMTAPLHSESEQLVREALQASPPRRMNRLPRSDYFYIILEIMVNRWLLHRGPVTSKWLMEAAGCSYPTTATALGKMKRSITRHSDRSVELRVFPREEWAKLLVVSDRVRSTARYADSSGRPRTPEELFRRVQKLKRADIAVGGTFGARHYFPDLDLHGNPILDLSIHAPRSGADLRFIEDLDPGLKLVKDPGEPAQLVIHYVRRKSSLFEPAPDGGNWADPTECMLDLHEARLEPQAVDFLDHFASRSVRDDG